MAIYRLLKNSTLEPEEISRITELTSRRCIPSASRIATTPDGNDREDDHQDRPETGVHDAAQLSALEIKELEIR